MTHNKRSKTGYLLIMLHWLIGLAPAYWAILLYTYVLRATNILGYWPSPYHPDPKTKILFDSIGTHYILASISWRLSLISIVPFILFIPLIKSFDSKSKLTFRIMTIAFLWLLALSLMYFDPGQFCEWYLD